MKEAFGKAAVRLSGLAARTLGWRPADFWAATPAELAACLGLADAAMMLDRMQLERLMENDDDRPG